MSDVLMVGCERKQPAWSLDLPPIEDRFAVQIAVSRVLSALSAGTLDKRLAGLFLYGIQIAASNLPRDTHSLEPQFDATVSRVVLSQQGEDLALPETAIEEHDIAGHPADCSCPACNHCETDQPHHPNCSCGLCHLFLNQENQKQVEPPQPSLHQYTEKLEDPAEEITTGVVIPAGKKVDHRERSANGEPGTRSLHDRVKKHAVEESFAKGWEPQSVPIESSTIPERLLTLSAAKSTDSSELLQRSRRKKRQILRHTH